MQRLVQWFASIFRTWKPWVVVTPWDIGVRVRLGKTATALPPGPHMRVPLVDEITMVNTRLRIVAVPSVAVGGQNGNAHVRTGIVGFSVNDPITAMLAFSQPETSVQAFAQAFMKDVDEEECTIKMRTEFEDKGVSIQFVRYVEDVDWSWYRPPT